MKKMFILKVVFIVVFVVGVMSAMGLIALTTGVHDVGLRIDYDGFGHAIRLNDPDNNPIEDDVPIVDCTSGYDIIFLTDNLGDFAEDVEINLTIRNSTDIVYEDTKIKDGLGVGESTSTGRKYNFIFDFGEGLYEILVNAMINEDDDLSDNVASREIEVNCPDCYNDDDCDDSDDYTEDSCINPGTMESYCEHLSIACLNNLDCGIDDYIGNNFCLLGDVYRDYQEFTCEYSGTIDSNCISDTESRLVKNCDYGCKNNECIRCEDDDNDKVCNEDDLCPNSKPEEVDDNGCTNPQFCKKQGQCGSSCDLADWKGNEFGVEYPGDCTTVIIHRGGEPEPYCAGLTCAD